MIGPSKVFSAIPSLLAVSLMCQIAAAQTHEPDHSDHMKMLEGETALRSEIHNADVRLTDTLLIDQVGASRRLQSDIIGERIIVVDFIFTTCTTICPVTTSLLTHARNALSDIGDDDLRFISISIDPNTDTPERMDEFARRMRADWTFLTGEKRDVDQVLADMDAYSTNPEDHAPMILVGDARSGKFIRAFGLPNPEFVETQVRRLLAERQHMEMQHDMHGH